MLPIRFLIWCCDLLKADSSDLQLTSAIVLGMFLGLTPVFTLHWVLGAALIFLFHFNLAAIVLSFLPFFAVSFFLDPIFHSIGTRLLTTTGRLIPLWTWMYHAPILPFTEFNHTIVMGRAAVTLVLALPLFLISMIEVKRYRAAVYHFWRTTKFYRSYIVAKQYAR